MSEYYVRKEGVLPFSETKLKDISEYFGGHDSKIHNLTGMYPNLPNKQQIELYNLLFDTEQGFENEAERFMFDYNKRTWLIWKNSKKNINVGDHVCSLTGGFGSSNGGTNMIVEDIDREHNLITLYNKSGKYIVVLDKWFLELHLYKKKEGI